MIKVAKFGGSSVAGADQFAKVKQIITTDPDRKVVISSAAGKRFSKDSKMTDLLYLVHAHIKYGASYAEILEDIRSRLLEIKTNLGLELDIESDFGSFAAELNKGTSLDYIVSRGEYFTSKLMAEYLGYAFVDASDCIFFQYDGTVDAAKTYDAIRKYFNQYGSIVIPGFYGSFPNGKIRVMSRGGSDITGALAAAALDASVYENWTDVSGILMADPRIVDDPKPIRKLTYGELRELAFMGASVLHEESVYPVKEKSIPLNIRNTNEPDNPGTVIMQTIEDDPESSRERFITGIAGRRDFTVVTVRKQNMSNIHELRKVLKIADMNDVFLEQITLGIDCFAFIAATSQLEGKIYDILGEIQQEVRPDDIMVKDGISLIASVGRKMTSKPGSSAKLFGALGSNGINIKTIVQSSDELSIMVGVDNEDFERAIRVLYEGFAG